MSIGGMVDWFSSQSPWTQIFFGIFLFLVAVPIAILIVMQFAESLRILGGSSRPADEDKYRDKSED